MKPAFYLALFALSLPALRAQALIGTSGNVLPGTPVSPEWNVGGNLSVGETANGTVTISGGAKITDVTGYLGTRRPYQGTMNVDGAGSTWTNTADIAVGNDGSGYLNITNGGKVTNRDGYVGINPQSYGRVTISGTDSLWESRDLFIGRNQSAGYVTITDGGKATASGETRLGAVQGGSSGSGDLTVSGAGSVFAGSRDLEVVVGNVTIAAGGKVSLGSPTWDGMVLVGTGNNLSSLNIGSPDLSNPGTAGTLEAAAGVYLHTSMARLNFNQTDTTTFSSPISGSGTVYQQGSGTTILSGTHDYTGETRVSAGTLQVDGTLSGSPVYVQSGGTLGGGGSVLSIIASSGSFIAPGDSIGTLTSAYGLTWNSGATLVFELGGGISDLLDLNGMLLKSGNGTFAFDFKDTGWQVGETYTLIEFASTNFTTGNFSFSNTGGFDGDFFLNGNSLQFQLTAVPETSSCVLAGLGALTALLRRRRI